MRAYPRDVTKPTSETIEQLVIERTGVAVLAADGEKPRRFSMLAYTGAEFDRWYGRAVIDLSGIEGPDKLPILLNHRDAQVVGYADNRKLTSEGLRLEGVLSKATQAGLEVAKLSDEGFPFTASVGVAVLSREELSDGATTKVNGREVRGPLSIWRKTRLGETSFITAFPADSGTEAHALMDKNATKQMQQNLPPASEQPAAAAPATLAAPAPETADQAKARLGRLRAAFPGRVAYDDNGNIGKRYRRQDEVGTPYCVTVDFETLEGRENPLDTVTLRHRDTGGQERVAIADLAAKLRA